MNTLANTEPAKRDQRTTTLADAAGKQKRENAERLKAAKVAAPRK